MTRVLFLQEHLRENHMKRENSGALTNVFLSTKAGQMLKSLVQTGLGLRKDQYYIDYAYSLVPKVVARDKYDRAQKYKPPSAKEAAPEYELLYQRIVADKPDMIVPSGNLGCKATLNQSAISKLRGIPSKQTFEAKDAEGNVTGSHTCWVLPMYSMEYMLVNPKVQNLVEADFVTLEKYINKGDAAFEAAPVEYEFVETIERVREIFEEVKKAPVTAWDLETNTLRPELPGAKPLVMSLSYKEGEGYTIPLEHKDFTWHTAALHEIYELLKWLVGDPDCVKVGANIQYDIRFLILTKNFKKFANHRDTKVMYYLLVNQAVEGSLKLSDLAFELTSMGGYDAPLEQFKKEYIANHIANEKARIEKMKEDYKQEVALEKAKAKAEGRKVIKVDKPKFPKASPPVNEVDGSDFNYEWIPLRSTLHPYASGDTDACLRIHNVLDAMGLKEGNERIRELYTKSYPALTVSLAKIEAAGIMMDTEYTKQLIESYTAEEDRLLQLMREFPEVQQLEEEHYKLYERGMQEMAIPKKDRDEEIAKLRDKYKKKLVFNPNSSDDKKKVLFEYTGNTLPFNKEFIVDSALEDGLTEEEIEWHHYKADKTALGYISENYPNSKELADLLLTHSLVKTRKQNFTYKLLAMIDPEGKIHGGFNSTGTETTRLSSSNPKLPWGFPVNCGKGFRALTTNLA